MIDKLFENKLEEYDIVNAVEHENVIQELVQHLVLAALSDAGFFKVAQFYGGTCLRIINGISRFSEDLDFILKEKNDDFKWTPYITSIGAYCKNEGLSFEMVDKSKVESSVKKMFLKTDSIGKLILIELPFYRNQRMKIKVKLEIDTNPPDGSKFETSYIHFPLLKPITTQDLSSSFAGKVHALLCRPYVKGRDWYDFIWYSQKKIIPNFTFLQSALNQQGPWAERDLHIDFDVFSKMMEERILSIDFEDAKEDIQRFLPTSEQKSLELWDTHLLLYYLNFIKQ